MGPERFLKESYLRSESEVHVRQGGRTFLAPNEFRALLEENGAFDHHLLPRWTVSAEEELHWRSETADGEAQASTLHGVIVGEFDRRKYWAERYGKRGHKSRPDCTSADGIVGTGSPGGRCNDCTLAHFDSGENRQPLCRHYCDLLVLRPGIYLPEYFVVPPASLSAYRRFRTKLAIAGVPMHGLLMSFGLTPAKNRRGVTYPEVIFDPVRKLTLAEFATADRYVVMFATLIKSNARHCEVPSGATAPVWDPAGKPAYCLRAGRTPAKEK
jgi:hypothetical protein